MDQFQPPMDPRVMAQLLMQAQAQQQPGGPVDPRLAWNRAGANTDEAFGFNALQRLTGLNLSPRNSAGNAYQPELQPQNRISETFRLMPGYY